MKASFPTEFDAVLLGKSREANSFQTGDGDEVKYGDAYELSFESSEGLAQTVRVTDKQLKEACGKDPAGLPKYQAMKVRGDVVVGEYEGRARVSFKPSEISLAQRS